MSERATSQWTKTLAEAYPITGKKGDDGEKWLVKTLIENGHKVKHFPSDEDKQNAGVDVIVDNITVDVKCNVKSENIEICGVMMQEYYDLSDEKKDLSNKGFFGGADGHWQHSFIVDIKSWGWLFNSKKTSKVIWHVNPENGYTWWYKRKEMQKYIRDMTKWSNLNLNNWENEKGLKWFNFHDEVTHGYYNWGWSFNSTKENKTEIIKHNGISSVKSQQYLLHHEKHDFECRPRHCDERKKIPGKVFINRREYSI